MKSKAMRMPPMTCVEFDAICDELSLDRRELARLMRVNIKTIGRWYRSPDSMNVAAIIAMRSWLRLHRMGLDWADRVGGRHVCDAIGLAWVPPDLHA